MDQAVCPVRRTNETCADLDRAHVGSGCASARPCGGPVACSGAAPAAKPDGATSVPGSRERPSCVWYQFLRRAPAGPPAIVFSNGHRRGIFPWAYLRPLGGREANNGKVERRAHQPLVQRFGDADVAEDAAGAGLGVITAVLAELHFELRRLHVIRIRRVRAGVDAITLLHGLPCSCMAGPIS